MKHSNSTGIRIKMADWKLIPATFRKFENGVWMVLTAGKYAPVLFV